MEKPKLLLIDADYAPYAFGNYLDVDAFVRTGEWLEFLYEKLGTRNAILCLSGKNNFRYQVAVSKPYKGNRKNKEKPPQYANIRADLISRNNCLVAENMEADDLLCILVEKYKDEYEVILVSDDKDFALCRCKQYRHTNNHILDVKDEIVISRVSKIDKVSELPIFKTVTKYYGEYAWLYQMLVGDSADNIPGVPGIGDQNKIFKTEFITGITIASARAIVWREYKKYYKENAGKAYLEQYLLLKLISSNKNV